MISIGFAVGAEYASGQLTLKFDSRPRLLQPPARIDLPAHGRLDAPAAAGAAGLRGVRFAHVDQLGFEPEFPQGRGEREAVVRLEVPAELNAASIHECGYPLGREAALRVDADGGATHVVAVEASAGVQIQLVRQRDGEGQPSLRAGERVLAATALRARIIEAQICPSSPSKSGGRLTLTVLISPKAN